MSRYFNPLPPCGGRLTSLVLALYYLKISIHSLRVEGDAGISFNTYQNYISIHSLRVEGDKKLTDKPFTSDISIHSLRVEGDSGFTLVPNPEEAFQSTPSVWRETSPADAAAVKIGISIHSLRVEGDSHTHTLIVCSNISIHSLRVEGDIFDLSRLGP